MTTLHIQCDKKCFIFRLKYQSTDMLRKLIELFISIIIARLSTYYTSSSSHDRVNDILIIILHTQWSRTIFLFFVMASKCTRIVYRNINKVNKLYLFLLLIIFQHTRCISQTSYHDWCMIFLPASSRIMWVLLITIDTVTFEPSFPIDTDLRTTPRNFTFINIWNIRPKL